MNISLTPELEKFIHEKVAGGMYTTASEVVRESLRLMHTYDDVQKKKITQLNKAIDAGMAELNQGKHIDGEKSRKKMKNKIDAISKEK